MNIIDVPLKEINKEVKAISSDEFTEQVVYLIWGAVVSVTKAFGKVVVKINPDTQRIFIEVRLRWWARIKKIDTLRKFWIAKAERKVTPFIPSGWKILIYYETNDNGQG